MNRDVPERGSGREPHSRLDRFRRNRTSRLTLRVLITVVGSVVIAVGAVLIPFPGPGWAIVIAGMAILALEYHWARRLLVFTKERLARWWHWLGQQRWWVRACVGLSGMLLIWVLVWWSIKTSLDFDVAMWVLSTLQLI
ncbi:MAG TPA: TIGR02611 family protein [Candidatus Stackebrandtia faecavium]|nr:TIGR02611 family protein [Candidatus Stackebrandtia faecavium]